MMIKKNKGTRYSVTLSPSVDQDLTTLTEDLQITKSEVLRRAIMLFKHAVKADKVELQGEHGRQVVLVK